MNNMHNGNPASRPKWNFLAPRSRKNSVARGQVVQEM